MGRVCGIVLKQRINCVPFSISRFLLHYYLILFEKTLQNTSGQPDQIWTGFTHAIFHYIVEFQRYYTFG
ncbi:MAG: hypothetical protein EA361_02140 [Bacteroidetes bacterium]|nr:MAG: hypothetical protein EA361_02140 [Bacteroidota bacterium]